MGHGITIRNLGPYGSSYDFVTYAYINGQGISCRGAEDLPIAAYQTTDFWCWTSRISGYGYSTHAYLRHSSGSEWPYLLSEVLVQGNRAAYRYLVGGDSAFEEVGQLLDVLQCHERERVAGAEPDRQS